MRNLFKWFVITTLLLLIMPVYAADKYMKITINNNTMDYQRTQVTKKECMASMGGYNGIPYFSPWGSYTDTVQTNATATKGCWGKQKTFVLELQAPYVQRPSYTGIGLIKFDEPAGKKVPMCDQISVTPYPSPFVLTQVSCNNNNESESKPAVLIVNSSYIAQPTVKFTINNGTNLELKRQVYFPLADADQDYYSPGIPPETITSNGSSGQISYYPYKYSVHHFTSPNTKLSFQPKTNAPLFVSYEVDDPKYGNASCVLYVKWDIPKGDEAGCTAEARVFNQNTNANKKISCELGPMTKPSQMACDVNVAISLGEHNPRDSQVTVNNQTDMQAKLKDFAPQPGSTDNSYTPTTGPVSSIDANSSAQPFTYHQVDGSTAEVSYSVADDMSCKLIYNQLADKSCESTIENESKDPVRDLNCTSTASFQANQCVISFNLQSGGYKERSITLDIKNGLKEPDGNYAALVASDISPLRKCEGGGKDTQTCYDGTLPQDITTATGNVVYQFPAGNNEGDAGAVQYRYVQDKDNYSYCQLNYAWKFDPTSQTKGCDVTAVSGKVGNPKTAIKCEVSSSIRPDGSSCPVSIDIEGQVSPPKSYNVTIENNQADNIDPINISQGNYSPAPSKIDGAQIGKFTYDANYQIPSESPSVTYVTETNQEKGCIFSYDFDPTTEGYCKASAGHYPSNYTVGCYECSPPVYNPADHSCNFKFALGGKCRQ